MTPTFTPDTFPLCLSCPGSPFYRHNRETEQTNGDHLSCDEDRAQQGYGFRGVCEKQTILASFWTPLSSFAVPLTRSLGTNMPSVALKIFPDSDKRPSCFQTIEWTMLAFCTMASYLGQMDEVSIDSRHAYQTSSRSTSIPASRFPMTMEHYLPPPLSSGVLACCGVITFLQS